MTVVLLHRTPDWGEHFDWLLQRPGGGPLITFRTAERPDRPPPWRMTVERLPDHREVYLTHEGPISGDRGEVRRIANGSCEVERDSPEAFRAFVRFAGHGGELTASPRGNSHWELDFHAVPGSDPAPPTVG